MVGESRFPMEYERISVDSGQVPGLYELYARRDFNSEYGISEHEFFEDVNGNNYSGGRELIEAWWSNLSPDKKREVINKEINRLTQSSRSALDALYSALHELEASSAEDAENEEF